SPDAHSADSHGVRFVYSGGHVYDLIAYDNSVGVRPAFYLNLLSASFTSGSGTAAAPYTVEGSGSYTPETEAPTEPPTEAPTEAPTPTPTPQERGFDATRDGWAFVNSASAFGYSECTDSSHEHEDDKTYYEPLPLNVWTQVFGAAVTQFSENLLEEHWDGNCYGMSAYAAAIYYGFEDWDDDEEVNETGVIKRIGNGRRYIEAPDSTTINMIERAQLSQCSEEASRNESAVTGKQKEIFRQVVENIQNENKTYIVSVFYKDGGHAMVTDTARGVEDSGDGWYKIYLYDPNYPHYDDYEDLNLVYNDYYEYWNMRWVNVNVNTGEWNMDVGVNDKEAKSGLFRWDKLYFEDPEWHRGHTGFTGYTIDGDNAVFANGSNLMLADAAGERLLEIEDGEITYISDNIEVYPYMTSTEDTGASGFSGKIKLNNEILGKASIGNAAFTLINNNKVTQVQTDDKAECIVSGGGVSVTADNDAEVKLISENMDSRDTYDAVTITGTLEGDRTITVNNKGNENYEITTDSDNKFDVTVSTENGSVDLDNIDLNDWNDDTADSDADAVTDFGSPVSSWAKEEVEEAYKENLIPENLIGKDLTKKVDRAEFASIAVKLYEELAGTKAAAEKNPFTDIATNLCKDDILKAYNLGITNGITDTTFEPNLLISREQVATMLTRAYKKSEFPGWTLATDGDYPLNYMGVTKYADDDEISDYAKESVYFMTRWDILNGVDDSHFAPKNNTTLGESYGYATREQAVVIALRSAKHL
ncbi:MAG: S-layer homology domain-containing protein, partial [Candidatus Ornithomonoglobus sp.]